MDIYREDLETELSDELIQLFFMVDLFNAERNEHERIEKFMYRIIIGHNFKATFPNVEIMLRIYLSLMVSNCTGERTFSKLNIMKSVLRSTMGQDRLNSLSLLSIECDVSRMLDYESIIVIDEFVYSKIRKGWF